MSAVIDASVLTDAGVSGAWAESVVVVGNLYAPHLVLVEATNVLRRLERPGELSRLETIAAQRDLLRLSIDLLPSSRLPSASGSCGLSWASRVTGFTPAALTYPPNTHVMSAIIALRCEFLDAALREYVSVGDQFPVTLNFSGGLSGYLEEHGLTLERACQGDEALPSPLMVSRWP
ncbi:MAG: type II toxin-antitoxin system VapC family toxin [Acidobacteriota bacterium]|nr:type II toxin-antitoxin system VapC family toxin [Acidobacteriota bacterium]